MFSQRHDWDGAMIIIKQMENDITNHNMDKLAEHLDEIDEISKSTRMYFKNQYANLCRTALDHNNRPAFSVLLNKLLQRIGDEEPAYGRTHANRDVKDKAVDMTCMWAIDVLLEKGIEITQDDHMKLAVVMNRPDVIDRLVQEGASVNPVMGGMWGPIYLVPRGYVSMAIERGNVKALKMLLHHGAPIQSVVNAAVSEKKMLKMLELIDQTGYVCNSNDLFIALGELHQPMPQVMRWLIQHNADPNNRILMSCINKPKQLNLLLKAGADPNVGQTMRPPLCGPLEYAIEQRSTESAKLLLQYGADPNVSIQLLNHKQRMRNAPISLLLKYGMDATNSPILVMVCKYRRFESCQELLDHNIDVNLEFEGKTAIWYAIQYDELETVKLLHKHGANIDQYENLEIGYHMASLEMIDYLLKHVRNDYLTQFLGNHRSKNGVQKKMLRQFTDRKLFLIMAGCKLKRHLSKYQINLVMSFV